MAEIFLMLLFFFADCCKCTNKYNVYFYRRVLCTADQTIDRLNRKIEEHKKNMTLLDNQRIQLSERQELLTGKKFDDDVEDEEASDLPKEIVSDKGIAVKVGGLYEIIEYES